MRILIASSEVHPYAKTGGLADVAAALPRALARLGHDVRVVMPRHRCVDPKRFHLLPVMRELDVFLGKNRLRGQVLRSTLKGSEAPIYFVQSDPLFDRPELYTEDGKDYPDNALRHAFFSLATIWMLKGLDWAPDVIQANDWQTALIPLYLRNWPILTSDPFYRQTRVLFTIHNLAYQGLAEPSALPQIGIDWSLYNPEGLEFFNKVNLLKGGIVHADQISTVSPTYAEEIKTVKFGCGLDGVLRDRASRLHGILNGIDTDEWNPAKDPRISAKFSADDLAGKAQCKADLQARCGLKESAEAPLLGVISRLAEQKGIELIGAAAKRLLERGCQLAVLGSGDAKYRTLLTKLAKGHPGQVSVNFVFDEDLAHMIEAGADLFLMPSLYEPCGLNQMYSLRYGTVPVVRATGGLADSVVDATEKSLKDGTATGYSFTEETGDALATTVERALDLRQRDAGAWTRLVKTGMKADFSWKASARKYEALFKEMSGQGGKRSGEAIDPKRR